MFNNFPAKKLFNPGGYLAFYFLPHSYIDTYPIIINGVTQVPVTLKAGTQWLVGYSTPETLIFTEESKYERNGTYYTPVVTGFAPGDKPELVDLMQKMESGLFIVMIKDSKGKFRLVGSPGAPLTLLANFNSGSKRSDSKGFSFKFTGEILYRAPETTF